MKELVIRAFYDGDKVCVLLGENLQEGVAGFGDTIFDALDDFKTGLLADGLSPTPKFDLVA